MSWQSVSTLSFSLLYFTYAITILVIAALLINSWIPAVNFGWTPHPRQRATWQTLGIFWRKKMTFQIWKNPDVCLPSCSLVLSGSRGRLAWLLIKKTGRKETAFSSVSEAKQETQLLWQRHSTLQRPERKIHEMHSLVGGSRFILPLNSHLFLDSLESNIHFFSSFFPFRVNTTADNSINQSAYSYFYLRFFID